MRFGWLSIPALGAIAQITSFAALAADLPPAPSYAKAPAAAVAPAYNWSGWCEAALCVSDSTTNSGDGDLKESSDSSHRLFPQISAALRMKGDFLVWHIATFRCAAEFGRYRSMADIDQPC
jgi:hypothetical protein